MKRQRLLPAIMMIAALALGANAQMGTARPSNDDTGFASYVSFGGTHNADGQIYDLTGSVGYNFSNHFGMDVGVPLYFVRPSSSTGASSSKGIGNPFADVHVKWLSPVVNFGSVLTGFAPAGDSKKGLSTGRGTYDWTNHVDHTFSNLTPFGELGLSNTIADSKLFLRPFTTLGFNTHFQLGANYDVWKIISVGASGYDIVPVGQQTVFSRVAGGSAAAASHGRVFATNQQTTGTADIAKDHGFSTWVDANPGRYTDMELAFTRSMVYDLNSVSFTIGVDVGRLYRDSNKKKQ
ncbi:MAG TPA: hypothetical protein VFJ47_16905 [Terriglobales bacterium]|nr:hypothetical protein [Terriglobales bacterium]